MRTGTLSTVWRTASLTLGPYEFLVARVVVKWLEVHVRVKPDIHGPSLAVSLEQQRDSPLMVSQLRRDTCLPVDSAAILIRGAKLSHSLGAPECFFPISTSGGEHAEEADHVSGIRPLFIHGQERGL